MTSANERERKSATVRARIEPSLKEAAERILDGIGLDPTTVVTALYRQIVARNGMPFEFELTDGKTRRSVQAARRSEVEQTTPGENRAERGAAKVPPEAAFPARGAIEETSSPDSGGENRPVVRKFRTRDSDDSPLPFPD